jgi:hypothetical protein
MESDDFMVLRYVDGVTQRIRLERESESIRRIEFLEGRKGRDREDRRGDRPADDFMVLQYVDGATQRIKLERESESIRQIEFLEGRRQRDREDWRGDRIRVIAATFGENCGVPYGNVTNHLAETCNGKRLCEYIIDYRAIGDPVPNCRKNYIAEWQCGNDPEKGVITVPESARGTPSIVLRCPVR